MAFAKLLTLAAMITVLPLALMKELVPTCRCLSQQVCPGFASSDVVLRATVLERLEPVEEAPFVVTYVLDPKKIYKGKSIVERGSYNVTGLGTISTTAVCGLRLELGTKYLIGLSQSDDGSFQTSLCGLAQPWSVVTKEERVSLLHGCEIDPCGGSCNEFQECLLYSTIVSRENYCADVCDPSPCEEGEKCTLEQLVQCIRAPCPKSAVCNGSEP